MRKIYAAILLTATLVVSAIPAFAGDTHGGGPKGGRLTGAAIGGIPDESLNSLSGPGPSSTNGFVGLRSLSADEDFSPAVGSSFQPSRPGSLLSRIRSRSLFLYLMLFSQSMLLL